MYSSRMDGLSCICLYSVPTTAQRTPAASFRISSAARDARGQVSGNAAQSKAGRGPGRSCRRAHGQRWAARGEGGPAPAHSGAGPPSRLGGRGQGGRGGVVGTLHVGPLAAHTVLEDGPQLQEAREVERTVLLAVLPLAQLELSVLQQHTRQEQGSHQPGRGWPDSRPVVAVARAPFGERRTCRARWLRSCSGAKGKAGSAYLRHILCGLPLLHTTTPHHAGSSTPGGRS